MPGQQVHVHVCVQYTWKNKGNVLEEIEYMGGVVGSGHAYWTMHTEACYTQVPGLAYMSDVHINQPVHCTSRHLRWRFCSWSTYNTWIKFSTASVKVEFRQRQKQPPHDRDSKKQLFPPPPRASSERQQGQGNVHYVHNFCFTVQWQGSRLVSDSAIWSFHHRIKGWCW